jgi:hypothetical protein
MQRKDVYALPPRQRVLSASQARALAERSAASSRTVVGRARGLSLVAGSFIESGIRNKVSGMSQGVDIARKLVEDLLSSFFADALGLELHEAIEQLARLPARHRERLEALEESAIWVAWVTDRGVVSATGRYDADQSRRTYSHVILIEWWISSDSHHFSWWRADPKHPTEWTAGR